MRIQVKGKIIHKKDKENRAKHTSLGDPRSDFDPFRVTALVMHTLESIAQKSLDP